MRIPSSGILGSVEWYHTTDVSGQPIGPVFNIPSGWNLKDVTKLRFKKSVDLRCEKSQNNEDLEKKRVSCEVSSVVLHAI